MTHSIRTFTGANNFALHYVESAVWSRDHCKLVKVDAMCHSPDNTQQHILLPFTASLMHVLANTVREISIISLKQRRCSNLLTTIPQVECFCRYYLKWKHKDISQSMLERDSVFTSGSNQVQRSPRVKLRITHIDLVHRECTRCHDYFRKLPTRLIPELSFKKKRAKSRCNGQHFCVH